MNCQQSTAEGSGSYLKGEIPAEHKCYVDRPPLIDVMIEQIEYLLTHSREGCPTECTDCARLANVEKWLLLPFSPAAKAMSAPI